MNTTQAWSMPGREEELKQQTLLQPSPGMLYTLEEFKLKQSAKMHRACIFFSFLLIDPFLEKMNYYWVGQAGLELLSSNNPSPRSLNLPRRETAGTYYHTQLAWLV